MATHETHSHAGQSTTGHEWDGIQEYNNTLPRWWLYIFYACIVFGIAWWILYPAWPIIGGYTKGVLGYSSRDAVTADLAEASAARKVYGDQIARADLAVIVKDPKLMEFALAGGKSAFGDNCAPCHGTAAQGGPSYPNLSDDDWLWGGSLDAIQQTIRFGVSSPHQDTRVSEMPAFGKDELLSPEQISNVVAYVMSLSNEGQKAEAIAAGKQVFTANCVACHGPEGKGGREFGAPNLADAIWLYGGDRQAIRNSVVNSRKSVMPQWEGRLPPETIKQLAIYVHSLGGGE
jgi:cytochrome c oxidase cbb3-type subunit 3